MDVAPVSVVIPAYNSEEFIGEALSSVMGQTLPVAEIIVVDDGSTDRTADVAARLGVSVIQQPHQGIAAARNTGIRAAKSEWIALQDADDIWEPKKIEYQWAAVSRYPDAGLVSCGLSQWIHGRPPEEVVSDVSNAAELERLMKYIPEPRGDVLAYQMNYYSPTMLIRRDLLFSVGLFDERVRFQEGVECYLRVMARSPIVLINLTLARQRIHHQNTSADALGMRLAWVKLVDDLNARPDKYPTGAAEVLGENVFENIIPLGREFLEQGRSREARGLFSRSLRKKFSMRAAVLWALSFLSLRFFNRLLTAKRRLTVLASRWGNRGRSSASVQ